MFSKPERSQLEQYRIQLRRSLSVLKLEKLGLSFQNLTNTGLLQLHAKCLAILKDLSLSNTEFSGEGLSLFWIWRSWSWVYGMRRTQNYCSSLLNFLQPWNISTCAELASAENALQTGLNVRASALDELCECFCCRYREDQYCTWWAVRIFLLQIQRGSELHFHNVQSVHKA